MHELTVLLLSLAANLDNLMIGAALGLKKTKIPVPSNILMAIMSMICAGGSLVVGEQLAGAFDGRAAGDIGGLLLILIGGLTFWSMFFERSDAEAHGFMKVIKEPKAADLDGNRTISLKESLFLGAALALNSIGTSFSAGLTSGAAYIYILSIGLFSFAFTGGGAWAGRKVTLQLSRLEPAAPVITGVLLILIGIYEIFY